MNRTGQPEFDLDEVMEKIRAEISKRGQGRKQPQAQAVPEETKNPVLLALRPVVNLSYKIPLVGPVLKAVVSALKKRLLGKSQV